MNSIEITQLLDALYSCYQKGCTGEKCNMLYKTFDEETNKVILCCAARKAAKIINDCGNRPHTLDRA